MSVQIPHDGSILRTRPHGDDHRSTPVTDRHGDGDSSTWLGVRRALVVGDTAAARRFAPSRGGRHGEPLDDGYLAEPPRAGDLSASCLLPALAADDSADDHLGGGRGGWWWAAVLQADHDQVERRDVAAMHLHL